MSAIRKVDSTQVARPLKVLAALIKDDLEHGREAADRASLPFYRAAGEKMLEAKAQLPHGEFMSWIRRNFTVGRTTAKYCMRLAEATVGHTAKDFAETFKGTTWTNVLREMEPNNPRYSGGEPRLWQQPVNEIVERLDTTSLNLKREELKRAEERDVQRQLAVQLIDIGYKVLARKLHPDRGGSRDAMSRLNAVRDRLKGCA